MRIYFNKTKNKIIFPASFFIKKEDNYQKFKCNTQPIYISSSFNKIGILYYILKLKINHMKLYFKIHK